MSNFFEDVGNLVTAPIRGTYNLITGNDKANSLGDIWNNSFGDANAVAKVVESSPGNQLYKSVTGGDLSKAFVSPSWDEWGKPGEAFAKGIDTNNQALPEFIQPYAQPIEAIALSAFNPFLGAAFQTAYQGGKQQEMNKGFDWGEFGKNAAINFGTAAVSSGANSLMKGADAANAAKSSANTLSSFNAATNTAPSLATTASQSAAQAGTQGATSAFSNPSAIAGATLSSSTPAMSSALNSTVNAGRNSTQGAVSAFDMPGASASLTPVAQSVQSSGLGNAAYKGTVKVGETLVNNTLAETLAPKTTSPLDGFDPNASIDSGGSTTQWGDVLNAFGGNEINTPNPDGNRIDSAAADAMIQRLSANNYLQQQQARDTALPAGQYQAPQNTPYANRLDEISRGTEQSYKDLQEQVNNANRYYGIIDSNPGLTTDQLDQYLADPSAGVLGNFTIPQDQASYFQGLRTLGPQNVSLIK